MNATAGGSMRAKISGLEDTLAAHSSNLNAQTSRVLSLEQQTVRMAAHIDEKMEELRQECARTIDNFREDANHKFSMQYAENKRLNAQMARQRAENQRLMDRIHQLEARCARLEAEIGSE